jgi:hypothetical protein
MVEVVSLVFRTRRRPRARSRNRKTASLIEKET